MKDKSTEWRNVLTPWLDFFKYEPLNSAVEGFQSENGKQCLEGLLKDTLLFDDTPCIVAWDTDKDQAAGFIINQTFYKDPTPEQAKPPVPFANQNWDPECLHQIMRLKKLCSHFHRNMMCLQI
ncbi:hypothetical protein EB796_005037 [Bugula neritina]|uniref:Uncharacterized protein n=1 Tax=Bugula neritina TaxID=10212 RepID=A0A7J7KFE2_BUGNE|nr:hypothetical protein EB796_005037 [Bugula neritina]